jgi:long-chain acyl-CoA synthetase
VGPAGPGVEVKIDNKGEIIYRSPGNFLGYYKNENATKKTLDKDGWIRSGDFGTINDTGHVTVIDRLVDTGKIASSLQFSPQNIENKLKRSPFIQDAIATGSGKEFVSAIIIVDGEATGNYLEKAGISFSGYADLSQQEMVFALIQDNIKNLNEELAKTEDFSGLQIKRFTILHKQLDPIDGELTQTGKLRRKEVSKRLKTLIEALHSNEDSVEMPSNQGSGQSGAKNNKVLLKIRDAKLIEDNGLEH